MSVFCRLTKSVTIPVTTKITLVFLRRIRTLWLTVLRIQMGVPKCVPTSITNENNCLRKSRFSAETWSIMFIFAVS